MGVIQGLAVSLVVTGLFVLGLLLWGKRRRRQWEEPVDSCEDSGPHNHNERPGGDRVSDVRPLVVGGQVLHRTERERTIVHHHHHRDRDRYQAPPVMVPVVIGQGGFDHLAQHPDHHQAITARHATIEAPEGQRFTLPERDGPSATPVEEQAREPEKSFVVQEDEGAASPAPVEETVRQPETFTLEEDEGAAAPAPVEKEPAGFIQATYSLRDDDEGARPAPVEQEEPSEPTQTYTRPSYEEAAPAEVEREPSECQTYSEPDNDYQDSGGGQEDSGSSDE